MFEINDIVEYKGRKAYIYELCDEHCNIKFLDEDKETTSVYYFELNIIENNKFKQWIKFKELYELKKKIRRNKL